VFDFFIKPGRPEYQRNTQQQHVPILTNGNEHYQGSVAVVEIAEFVRSDAFLSIMKINCVGDVQHHQHNYSNHKAYEQKGLIPFVRAKPERDQRKNYKQAKCNRQIRSVENECAFQ
jgi:hypothetical protein